MAIKKGNNILLVDNEIMVRDILHNKLNSTGYQCDEAVNPDQALHKLENNKFDLMILDVATPGVSVVELLPKLKADYPNMGILVAIPVKDANIGIECIKLGAHEYITKPLFCEKLICVVDTVLLKRRLSLLNKDYVQYLEGKVIEQTKELHDLFLHTLTTLAYAIEAKDKYTSGHSERVAIISEAISKKMCLPPDVIEKIHLAALLHDIGKIGVSGSILNKEARLTPEEFQYIQGHSVIGEHILTPIINDKETLNLVRNHHEHCDGSGYPDHLENTQISVGSKIIAVADAYDAMTSDRPYRNGMSSDIALDELNHSIGTQFDSDVVHAMCHLEEVGVLV